MSFPPNHGADNPPTPAVEDDANRQSRKLAGKYESVEELEQGYTNQFGETQRIIGERDVLNNQVQLLQAELARVQMQRGTFQPPADPGPVFPDEIQADENGRVDLRAVRSSVERTVQDTVQQAVGNALAPLLRGAQARTQMLAMDPEYANHEAQAAALINSNPIKKAIYDELVATNPLAAMQLANAEYRAANAHALAQRNAAEQDANQRSQVQAGIVTPNAQGRAPQPDFDPKTAAKMLENAQQTGDFSGYLDYRMKGMFPNWQFANAGQAWDQPS